MEAKNLNEIMKQDPSLEKGKFSKVFERQCPVEMKIVEQNIIQMVNQDIRTQENLHFKLLTRGKERMTTINKGEESIGSRPRDIDGVAKETIDRSIKVDADQNPDQIRLEILSDNDFFF